MAYARSSLLSLYLAAVAWNASANSFEDVCVFHFVALALYSYRHSPWIHLYAFVSSPTFCLLTGGDVSAGLSGRAYGPAVPSMAATTGMEVTLGLIPL
jgi:hypothetical protein